MIVTSSCPVKERLMAFHSKYILLQPSPVGRGPGTSLTLSWKANIWSNPDLESYWDCGQ